MDYEKEYKEALDKFKKFKEKYFTFGRMGFGDVICDKTGTAQDELDAIFPELRESEDERTRKELIYMIKERTNWAHKEEYVKYLEKQKENPKSADSIPSDRTSDAKCEDRSPKHSDSDGTDIRDTPAYWRGWDDAMKQKEQKHPHGCFTCDEYKKGYEEGRRNGFTAGYNKAIKEVEQKQEYPLTPDECIKPTEWSEIEVEFRGEKVKVKRPFFRDDKGRGYSTTEQDDEVTWNALRAWAESHGHTPFELYPKEEWSEEDERMLSRCIKSVECSKQFADSESYKAAKDVEMNWLNSLRPSWKPSEEQMEALEDALEAINTKTNLGRLHLYQQGALGRLYQDLKKL